MHILSHSFVITEELTSSRGKTTINSLEFLGNLQKFLEDLWYFADLAQTIPECGQFCFIHFLTAFPLRRVTGAAILWEVSKCPHSFQHSLLVLLAPHQDGANQGRRCRYSTRPFVDLWAVFLCVYSQQNFPLWSFLGHFGHVAEWS